MDSAPDILRTATLLDRARDGDEWAMQELFRVYQPRLEAFVHGRLPASHWIAHETLDAVQEVWVRAMASLDRFQDQGSGAFWAWLRTIARNLVRDCYRRAGVRPEVASLDETGALPIAGHATAPEARVMSFEESERFEAALESLSPDVRSALLLRLEMGLEYRQIAVECGFSSPDAARMAVTRATQRLARELAQAE